MIGFSSTISLGVILLGIVTALAAGWAVWRTQSVAALRQANVDLRADRDDWKERYEAQVTDNARLEARVQTLSIEVARLQGMTDTTGLARQTAVEDFRKEVRQALNAFEDRDTKILEIVTILVSRDPALRTRVGDSS